MLTRVEDASDRLRARAAVAAAAGLSGLLLWSRLAGLGQSLWHDEIFTIVNYTHSPLAPFAADYIPNNHILFSLLTAVTVDLLGGSEVVYRLWSVVPAIASVVAIAWWAWRRMGRRVALTVGTLLVMNPLHLELSFQARGYGLAFLAMTGVVIAASELVTDPGSGNTALLALAGFVGIATLPVFVLPFVAVVSVIAVSTRERRLLPMVSAVGFASLLWYLPVLGELLASTSQEFGETLGPIDVFTQPVTDLLAPEFALVISGIPRPGWWVLAYALVALVLVKSTRVPRPAWWAMVLAIVGTYGLLAAGRFHTDDRFVSFLVVPTVLLVGAGVIEQIKMGPSWRRRLSGVVTVVTAVLLLISFLPVARRTAALPREDFAGVDAMIETLEDPRVVTNTNQPLGLRFYVEPAVMTVDPSRVEQVLCRAEPPFVYVEHVHRSPDLDQSCLEDLGARHVRLPQRARGEFIDLWILDPTS